MAWFWSSTKTLVAEKERLESELKSLKGDEKGAISDVEYSKKPIGLAAYNLQFERESIIKLKTIQKKLEILSKKLEYVKNLINKRHKKELDNV